jgi:hypothetical protein
MKGEHWGWDLGAHIDSGQPLPGAGLQVHFNPVSNTWLRHAIPGITQEPQEGFEAEAIADLFREVMLTAKWKMCWETNRAVRWSKETSMKES